MIYRKKHLDKKLLNYKLTKANNLNYNLNYKLKLSFKKNYCQNYKKRFSFFLQKFYHNKHLRFYNSQNKLQCFITYSMRVPQSKVLLSRFFLVKNSNSLLLGGYQK